MVIKDQICNFHHVAEVHTHYQQVYNLPKMSPKQIDCMMKVANLQGFNIQYIVEGSGEEPVVFIHGSMIADAYAPLL
jgi:hypothetical protein